MAEDSRAAICSGHNISIQICLVLACLEVGLLTAQKCTVGRLRGGRMQAYNYAELRWVAALLEAEQRHAGATRLDVTHQRSL